MFISLSKNKIQPVTSSLTKFQNNTTIIIIIIIFMKLTLSKKKNKTKALMSPEKLMPLYVWSSNYNPNPGQALGVGLKPLNTYIQKYRMIIDFIFF